MRLLSIRGKRENYRLKFRKTFTVDGETKELGGVSLKTGSGSHVLIGWLNEPLIKKTVDSFNWAEE